MTNLVLSRGFPAIFNLDYIIIKSAKGTPIQMNSIFAVQPKLNYLFPSPKKSPLKKHAILHHLSNYCRKLRLKQLFESDI